MSRPLSRHGLATLPIRVRLVAGFSLAMLVVLVAAGAFVYWRVEYALDRGLDTELAQATATIAPTVEAGPRVTDPSRAEATGTAWQVLDGAGVVVAHAGAAPSSPLVDAGVLGRVGAGPLVVDRGSMLPISSNPYRMYVTRVPHGRGYLVVAVRRDHRDEALRELLAQLGIAGLAALLVTSFVGDRLARAALAPVERYRRRAAEIAAGSEDVRLDVPPVRDDEVTRLGHTLNEMLAALEAAMEEQERFVHEASHELRTPLTLLQSRLQLTARRPRTVAEHERTVEELTADVARLVGLAEQLLALGGSSAVDETGADVVAVVSACAERHGPTRTSVAGDVPPGARVRLGEVALERVVTNLLVNAEVHGAPPVAVTVDHRGGWVRVTVTDAGEGMSPELLAGAVARFARAPQARARPGSGLGLSLVDSLVRAAGGELRLCHREHHVGHGTTSPFTCGDHAGTAAAVCLPLVEAGAVEVRSRG